MAEVVDFTTQEFLTKDDLASWLKIHKSTIERWARGQDVDEPLPYYKLADRAIRYKKQEILEWLARHRQTHLTP